MKKSIIPALVLAVLCSLSAAFVATAQPGRMHGGHGGPMDLDRLAEYLSLTAAQKTQAQEIREKTKQAIEPLFEEHKQLVEQVEAALESNADAATVGAAVIAAHEQGKKIRAVHDQHDAELEAILTPAQLSRWRALKDARKMMHPRIPGLGGPGHD
ncbi:MAG TPA: periplasmic heavy metal sensor [Thermoanaerobaculia bacterium]|nr:periplasmic heavy metal sensor [Thermoanaerobaculia bacterium]